MRRRIPVVAIVLAGIILVPFCQARSAENDVDAHHVYQSIEKGVAYLKRTQTSKNGTWPDHGGQVGGVTALCTLALINSGVPIQDVTVQRSLTYLRTLKPSTTYVTSLQTMVFCLADPKNDLPAIKRNAEWLEETQIKAGPRGGSWSYPGLAVGGDNSNSHFAMIALYEAQRAGAIVRTEIWQTALDYWKSAQNPTDRAFGYFKAQGAMEVPSTGSMTCAGITSLAILSAMLPDTDASIDGEKIKCCGNRAGDDSAERIDGALRWLGSVFSVERNPQKVGGGGRTQWLFYYLQSLEQTGRLTGRQRIGDHDWYREGAAFLSSPNVQQIDGKWQGAAGIEADPNIATAFALLFLSEGRRPILVSKLEFGPKDDWNHHRHDIANLVRYVETKWNRDFPLGLSWQSVDISTASVDELLLSPVLFMSGNEAPGIDEKLGRMLREYVDRGGYIFAEACCKDGEKFDRGFRELLTRTFSDGGELKPLPADHPIWGAEEAVPADNRPLLLGLERGGQTRIIFAPPPGANGPTNGLSGCWELSSNQTGKPFSIDVAARIAVADSIGINFLAYATGRKLKTRDEYFRATKE